MYAYTPVLDLKNKVKSNCALSMGMEYLLSCLTQHSVTIFNPIFLLLYSFI